MVRVCRALSDIGGSVTLLWDSLVTGGVGELSELGEGVLMGGR